MNELDILQKHKNISIVASAEGFYKGKHFNIEHLLKISEILNISICSFFELFEE